MDFFFFLFQFLFTLSILDKWVFAPLPALWGSTPEDRQQQLNNMAVCIDNLHSVQHPNFLRDYCFYFHKRPVIKGRKWIHVTERREVDW